MFSLQNAGSRDSGGWLPSLYYAEAMVSSTLASAWDIMLNYPAWNPGFVGATMTRIRGEPNREGEVVSISLVDAGGVSQPPFYAHTLKVVPHRRIAWYCYPNDDAFRIFLEFGLAEVPPGVRFSIRWFALDNMPAEALPEHQAQTDATVQNLAVAFKAYCEAPAEGRRSKPL